MTHYPVSAEKLKGALTARIEESQAEIDALKAVKINTSHKTLTNRAIEGGKIADYIGIDKALNVYYQYGHRYLTAQVTAYDYNDQDGNELGSKDGLRISRTITPAELRKKLDFMIEAREAGLRHIEKDLANADEIAAKHNKLTAELNEFMDGLTWATRGALN